MDENPITETRAAVGKAKPETVKEPGASEKVSQLRQRASLNFLGYTFRYDRDLKGRDQKYLNMFPSKKAVQREREKLHEMTDSSSVLQADPELDWRAESAPKGVGELLFHWVLHGCALGDRLVRARSPDQIGRAHV